MTNKGFKIIDCHGFHMTFKNGVTVSVQFGAHNYCGRYPYNLSGEVNPVRIGTHVFDLSSSLQSLDGVSDAEIAIFDKDGRWITREFRKGEEEVVLGYQSPEDVLKAMIFASNYKEDHE